jgi:membrane dipeptidase
VAPSNKAYSGEYGRFDFGLSAEDEERAERLHRSSILIDLHWQGPLSPDTWTAQDLAEVDEALAGRLDLEFAWGWLTEKALRGELPRYGDLYVESGITTGLTECTLGNEEKMLREADKASRMVSSFDWSRRARSADDIRDAKAAGAIAFWGICAFNVLAPDQLDLVGVAHELGILDLTELAYNRQNFIAAGCTERYDPGLTNFGVDFVRRCNEVGVIVDTAHTGHQSTLDACAVSEQPVVASHTSAAALHRHDRAKTDDEFEAIAASGGVVGIYAIPFFLGPPDAENPTIELMLDHIDYVVRLVGWRHVAIGSDWPLAMPHEIQRRILMPQTASIGFRPEHKLDITSTLEGFRDPRDWRNITRGLVARGYGDEEIRGILGENFLRVFEQVVG